MQAGSPDSNHEPEPAVSQSPVPPSLRQPKDESGNMDAQMRLPVPKLQSHAKDADVQVGVRPMPTSGQHTKQDSHPESLSARPQSFLFDEESDPIAEANAQLNLELRQLRSKESISSKHAIPKFADRVMHVHIPALDDQHVWRTLAVTYKAAGSLENSEAFRKSLLYVCHDIFFRAKSKTPQVMRTGVSEFLAKISHAVQKLGSTERETCMKLLAKLEARRLLHPDDAQNLRGKWTPD